MQFESKSHSIEELMGLRANQLLSANPEYQRGAVWSLTQKRKLIDSILRGYPLPLLYVHHVEKNIGGYGGSRLEIIDGQQRLNAIWEFQQGAFKLFDPKLDAKEARFPRFVTEQACTWGRRDFEGLSESDRQRFLGTSLNIAIIRTDSDLEVRDLFIRLQSGLPLNHQETRDAWPGGFPEFILRLAGKANVAKYAGHEFFQLPTVGSKGEDRGKQRQLAAQTVMLLMHRWERGAGSHTDIGASQLTDFYYENLDFDAGGTDAAKIIRLFDKAKALLTGQKIARLKGHDVIHMMLLIDDLLDTYTRGWEDDFVPALNTFMARVASASKDAKAGLQPPYWVEYGQLTRTSSDSRETIGRRHNFYAREMRSLLPNLQSKDPVRLFGPLERHVIWYGQHRRCAVCKSTLDLSECETHHVEEHSKGGGTVIENGAAVHKECHPKGAANTAAFAKLWPARRDELRVSPDHLFLQELGLA
jgi:5-methylcytosine-specific restriction endonuclease McrA